MHRMAVLITLALVARAQVPTQDASALRFEVASLKTSPPGGRGGGIRPTQAANAIWPTVCPCNS
jgi:hypothetical protein